MSNTYFPLCPGLLAQITKYLERDVERDAFAIRIYRSLAKFYSTGNDTQTPEGWVTESSNVIEFG